MNIKKTIVAAGTAVAFGLPALAQAQPAPGYAAQGEQIRGTIASLGGK